VILVDRFPVTDRETLAPATHAARYKGRIATWLFIGLAMLLVCAGVASFVARISLPIRVVGATTLVESGKLGWIELPKTKLHDVCPTDAGGYQFSFYCAGVIRAWSAGVMDTRRNRLLLWGGGHNDYYGNELYALNLNELTLTRLNDPGPINPFRSPTCVSALSDGSPNARHTYNGVAYLEHVDRLWAFGGSLACAGGGGGDDTWTLDLASLKWQKMDPVNISGARQGPLGTPLAAVSAYDRNSRLVFLHDRKALWSYKYETNTYTQLRNDIPISVYNNSVIDPKRKLMFIVGAQEKDFAPGMFVVDLSAKSNYAMQDWSKKVTGCEAFTGVTYPGLAYDSEQDRIVAWTNTKGRTNSVSVFDPDSKSCTERTFAGGPEFDELTRGDYRFQYSSALNLFTVINGWQQNAYVLRLTPGKEIFVIPTKPPADAPAEAPGLSGGGGAAETKTSNSPVHTPKEPSSAFGGAANEKVVGKGIVALDSQPSQNAVAGSAEADFAARCAAPGVIRCYGFDNAADADQYIRKSWSVSVKYGTIVSDVKASGAGSLRFLIPSQSGSGDSGSFSMNFSQDLSAQFGEGDEFYIQWRQRFSPELLSTHFTGGDGWKQVIIADGDKPGRKSADACTQLQIVLQNVSQRGVPQLYHSCGEKDGQYEPLNVYRGGKYEIQNGTKPPCLWQEVKIPPCFGYKANQWMTFQIHVKIGTWYKNDKKYHRDSTIQLWVAEEWRPSQLVIDFSPTSGDAGGYDLANEDPTNKYGKIWLTPYHTHKDGTQVHPTMYTWYDELIVSRKKIADPAASPRP
jgi:hypothetical protein